MAVSRRQVLAGGAALSAMTMLRLGFGGKAFASEGFGPLVSDPNGLLDLPAGFSYKVFGKGPDGSIPGDPLIGLDGTNWGTTPAAHDGMAAFTGPRGTTVLVRNHENSISSSDASGVPVPMDLRYDKGNGGFVRGGTTNLVVDKDNDLIASYPSVGGHIRNCAGGPTPWGSWLTCEETTITPQSDARATVRHGYVFEVPALATGPVAAAPLKAMGRFSHEAVCVDPETGVVYETEDEGSSLLYRFTPNEPRNLAAGGVLEALKVKDFPGGVNTATNFPVGVVFECEWVGIPNVDPASNETPTRTQGASLGAAIIRRGEGIWWSTNDDAAFIVSTSGGAAGRGQIFKYSPRGGTLGGGTLELFIEAPAGNDSDPNVSWAAPDNICVAPWGDLVICEDGGGVEYLWIVSRERGIYRFAKNALNGSELAGACFAPNGRTLFVNLQSPGHTFAITGPFRPLHSTPGY